MFVEPRPKETVSLQRSEIDVPLLRLFWSAVLQTFRSYRSVPCSSRPRNTRKDAKEGCSSMIDRQNECAPLFHRPNSVPLILTSPYGKLKPQK
jgi:hypothetical protein